MRRGQREKSSTLSRQEAQEATRRREFKGAKTLLSRLGKKRKAALTATLKRLMVRINGLGKDKLAELKSLVNEKELAIIEERVRSKEPATLSEIARSFSVTRERISQIEEELLTKIEKWTQGKDFERTAGTRTGKSRRIERIRKIIEERLSKGESLDEIKRNARLSETEKEILDTYILAEERITQGETAKKLGKSITTIAVAIMTIEDKLIDMKG